MEHQAEPQSAPGPKRDGDWSFRVILLFGILLAGYVLLWHGLAIHERIAAYLPLLLPLAVTVLSIFTRVTGVRDYEAVLKMSNDIAIGIISFDIWALSASRSDPAGRILVNTSQMIRGDFVLPFLLFGLLIAVGCVVLTHYRFSSERTKQRWLLAGLVASALVYITPFGTLEAIKPLQPPEPTAVLHRYTVVVPYQDPDITAFAPTFLRDRLLVHFERGVEAASVDAAKAQAMQRFLEAPAADRVKTKGEKAVVRQDAVLAVPE